MSDVTDKIEDLLSNLNIKYKKFEHAPVTTSEDAARIRDKDISSGAKSLVFIADDEPILVVVPGDKRFNTKRFKAEFKIKDLYMADTEKLKDITGLIKGAVPPIGKIFGVKTYFDQSFTNKDIVAFNAGSLTISIEMRANDLISASDPIIADLTND